MENEKIQEKIKLLKHKRVVLDGKIARLESSLETGITNVKKAKVDKKVEKVTQKTTESEPKAHEKSIFDIL